MIGILKEDNISFKYNNKTMKKGDRIELEDSVLEFNESGVNLGKGNAYKQPIHRVKGHSYWLPLSDLTIEL